MCLKFFTLWCLRGILLLNVSMVPGESFAQSEDLTLELSMKEFYPAHRKILIELCVTNPGKNELVLPHLQEGLMEQYGIWGTWFPNVFSKQAGKFWFPLEGHALLTNDDLITLGPGESFSVTIELANMHLSGKRLADTEGRYIAEFWLGLDSYVGRIETFSSSVQPIVWKGNATSNTLEFLVVYEKRRMFFPGGISPFLSPDKRYALVNVDSKHNEQRRLQRGEHILYLRETRTGEQDPLYTYDDEVEVLWSPEGNYLLINDAYVLAFIVFLDQRELVDVKEQLQQTLDEPRNIFMNQRVSIRGREWVDEHRVKLEMRWYDEKNHRAYTHWYEYDMRTRAFKMFEGDGEEKR